MAALITQKIIKRLNVVRWFCDHLLGEKQTYRHRIFVGVALMLAGVYIAHLSAHIEPLILSLLGDGAGYSLHGLGLVPVIEALAISAAAST